MDFSQARNSAWAWFRQTIDARFHGMLGDSSSPYRTLRYRRDLARRRLERDRDAWLATRDDVSQGVYVLPLSFYADGSGIWFATKRHRRIAGNVSDNPKVEVILGGYLDAIIVDGDCDTPTSRPPADIYQSYVKKAGYTPSLTAGFVFLRVAPRRLRVSRSPAEFDDRDVWTIEAEPWESFLTAASEDSEDSE